jgi:hypothetical protein
MRLNRRKLSLLIAVGYGLTIATAALFHSHSGCEREGHCGGDGYQAADGEECRVCQFLAQKPVAAQSPAPADLSASIGAPVDVSLPAAAAQSFSAWQSRAPPLG